MEEKKITEIKAGTRVTVNGRECSWGTGTVVLQNENTGRCLIRFDKPAGGMHDAGGLFRERCCAWCEPEEMTVTREPEEEQADPKKELDCYAALREREDCVLLENYLPRHPVQSRMA